MTTNAAARLACAIALITTTNAATAGPPPSRIGWTADFTTYFHDVSGTATITSDNTIIIENFNYDGAGAALGVDLRLAAADTNNAYELGLPLTGDIRRAQPYNNETFGPIEITFPEGVTIDDYTYISVWCIGVGIDFGSGLFVEPPTCPADLDADGQVEAGDLSRLLGAWGTSNPDIDLIKDGIINSADLARLLSLWGPCL